LHSARQNSHGALELLHISLPRVDRGLVTKIGNWVIFVTAR
jgi:hypothetical protein